MVNFRPHSGPYYSLLTKNKKNWLQPNWVTTVNAQAEKDKLIPTATDAPPLPPLFRKKISLIFVNGGNLYHFQGPFLVKVKKTNRHSCKRLWSREVAEILQIL